MNSFVPISVEPTTAAVTWVPETSAALLAPGSWSLAWPHGDGKVTLANPKGEALLALPTPAPTPIVHKKQWWNVLFANPGGYLSAEAPISAVHIGLPTSTYLPFGPAWMRSWLTAFLLGVFVFSLAIKLVLRIH